VRGLARGGQANGGLTWRLNKVVVKYFGSLQCGGLTTWWINNVVV